MNKFVAASLLVVSAISYGSGDETIFTSDVRSDEKRENAQISPTKEEAVTKNPVNTSWIPESGKAILRVGLSDNEATRLSN